MPKKRPPPLVAQRLAWAQKQPLRGNTFRVLVYLIQRANKAGECWPEQRTIASDTHVGKRSVERAIRELQAAGLITITRKPRHRLGQHGCRNHYRLNVNVIFTKPSPVSVRSAKTYPPYLQDLPANRGDRTVQGTELDDYRVGKVGKGFLPARKKSGEKR